MALRTFRRPDQPVWFTWLCHRCERLFKAQGIARLCGGCRGRDQIDEPACGEMAGM